jgi:alpha-beta hydrolase superfamily lysophospholipase
MRAAKGLAMGSSGTARTEYLDGADGMQIHMRSWRPAGRPRAVIVISHGFNSHSGQHVWTAQQFVARGFAVYAADLRGRGKSDGERFLVTDVREYLDDLALAMRAARARDPGLPVYLLGHGAGGVIACSYALERQSEVAGLICESYGFGAPAPGIVLDAIALVGRLAPRFRALTLANHDLTRDGPALSRLNADPMTAYESQPAATVGALRIADRRLRPRLSRLILPLLVLHGSADRTTRPAASIGLHRAAASFDKTLRLYEGHYHDLLNDTGKEKVMADILCWIGSRLPAARPATRRIMRETAVA